MFVFGLCLVLPLVAAVSGTSIKNNSDIVNSGIGFTNRGEVLLDISNSNNLSPQCSAHFEQYKTSLVSGKKEDVWALRMFDARSKLPSGLLDGNFADLGSFDECLNIEAELPQSSNIFGKYCIGNIPVDLETIENGNDQKNYLPVNQRSHEGNPRAKVGTQVIQWATCIPHSCSAADSNYIHSKLNITFREELCQIRSSQPKLDDGSIMMISFLGLILWLVIVSTMYDTMLYYTEKKPHHSILIAFSALTNSKRIMAISNSPNQISCLHGFRVISTMWVILLHKYDIQCRFPLRNYLDVFKWKDNPANMFVLGSSVSVDTFLLMSGLVAAYTFMSSATKGKKFNVIMYYVHRYLRLTPVLAVVVFFHLTLLRYSGSGPLWPSRIENDYLVTYCEKYWWKTLLYVQNYGDQIGPCVPQSWYLSVDMQLFLLSPLLLVPLSKWPKITLLGTGFLTACSIVASFLISWSLEIEQNMFLDANPLKRSEYFYNFYYPTHTRAAPWLIGIVIGYFVFVIKQRKTKLTINKAAVLLIWTASLAVCYFCVFCGHEITFGEYDKVLSSFHLALMRPAWAIAVGSIIFLCVNGYGGPVNSFLSLPVFEVLSKLTYTQYLAHYTIIYLTIAGMRMAPLFGNAEMLYAYWGDFAFTSVVALVLALSFELPMITIEKVLFEKEKR